MRQEQSRDLKNETWGGVCLGQAEAAWKKVSVCFVLFFFCSVFRHNVATLELL